MFLCHKTEFQRETRETLFSLQGIKGPQQIPNLINIFNNSDNKLTATALEALCHLVKFLSKMAINQRRNAEVLAHVCCLFQCGKADCFTNCSFRQGAFLGMFSIGKGAPPNAEDYTWAPVP